VETLLRKYLWAFDLAVIAICATFAGRAAARATATAVETSLLRGSPASKHVPRTAAPAAASTTVYSKQVEEILKRNIFCSGCPPILGTPEGAAKVDTGPPPVQRTTLNLKVLAIMFAPRPADPRWSIAIIRDNDDKSTGPYSIGMKLRDATISDIQEARVYLDFGGGRQEYIDLLDVATPPPGAPQPVAAAPAAPDPLGAEMDKGIKKTGEHSYEVQRSTVDALLGNMGALAKGARIVPETRDGKSAGFRLFSIRPEGPFAKIGLQNGDVISAINGLDMSSPDKALEVYTKLKTANHLSVGVERNGQKITQDYNIR
jgi:general secretion pathway protein C